MSTKNEIRFYKLRANVSAGVFGETYAVTALDVPEPGETTARAEWVVFISRPKPIMIYGGLRTCYGVLPGDLGVFGPNEVHQEAAQQAQLDLLDKLAVRAKELGRPEIEFVQLELEPIATLPLVSAWIRGLWHPEIRKLGNEGETVALSSHCKLICRLNTFTRVETDL